MKTKPKYRFEILTGTKCGTDEIKDLSALTAVFFTQEPGHGASGTDIKIACRHHHVFVVRERVAPGEPIVGVLLFAVVKLFQGPVGMIECPVVRPGYESLSDPLFEKAIKFAKEQGIEVIRVLHQVRGVRWQNRKVLDELGFVRDGAHLHSLSLT